MSIIHQVIILVAGEGIRLRPYTKTVPKGMVSLDGKPIIARNMAQWETVGDCEFHLVTGYRSDALDTIGNGRTKNPEFGSTNMVWSLAYALPHLETLTSAFVYVSYGDIVVHANNIRTLISAEGNFCVHVDRCWEELWSMRMDNYFDDVETLVHDGDRIIELGKRPTGPKQVQGQYIGLMRFDRLLLLRLLTAYREWVLAAPDEETTHARKNIYMTDFIQDYIDHDGQVTPVFIDGGWLEVDTVADLEIYQQKGHAMPLLKGLLE